MLDLKKLKEVAVSYSMHSPFLKWILNSWATKNKIIFKKWEDLVTPVLGVSPQLQWGS